MNGTSAGDIVIQKFDSANNVVSGWPKIYDRDAWVNGTVDSSDNLYVLMNRNSTSGPTLLKFNALGVEDQVLWNKAFEASIDAKQILYSPYDRGIYLLGNETNGAGSTPNSGINPWVVKLEAP